MGAFALCFLTVMLPGMVLAHESGPPRDPWWSNGWGSDPWLLACLTLSLALYVMGVSRLWARAGAYRGISRAQATAFVAGWLALFAALLSPLDALSAWLFSAHMLQHELLMIVAAPLLVLGRPLAAWAWALPPAWRKRIAGIGRWAGVAPMWAAMTQPFAAWTLHAAALWLWHVPALFEAALHSTAVHVAQHLSFLATSLLFWWAVLGSYPRVRGRSFAFASLFTTMMHTSALGALLTLAPTPWYPGYLGLTAAFGLDPIEDQQLGGLVMWVPGGFTYLAATLVLLARLMSDRDLQRSP